MGQAVSSSVAKCSTEARKKTSRIVFDVAEHDFRTSHQGNQRDLSLKTLKAFNSAAPMETEQTMGNKEAAEAIDGSKWLRA